MDKVLDIYSSVLKGYLSKRFINEPLINSIDLNKERFNVDAVFTASIFFLKYNSSRDRSGIVSQTDRWLSSYFSEDNLFSSIINKSSKELIDTIDKSLYDIIGIESIHIPSLYENLLGIEAGNENNRTEVGAAKNYRNKLGSYYTPDNLAKTVTQQTIDEFIAINFDGKNIWRSKNPYEDVVNEMRSVTFADFSCGGGNFLIEIIHYFERLADYLNLTPDKRERLLVPIAKNISAFDVDCLALEVAKLSVLLRIEQPSLYNELSKNFIHGNFLLLSDFPVDETKKLDVFASGFIYHESLSIDKNRVSNYDIVLGNPPWEKIRFEEKKFYALFESSIQNNHFKATRKIEIADIKLSNPYLASFSLQYQLEIEKAKKNLKRGPLFSLSNNGELNTYALFTELAMKFRTNRGIAGLVLKSAIATSQVNQKLFRHLTREHRLIAIYDFINRKKIFSIDTRERFCFILIGKARVEGFRLAMNLLEVKDIENPKFKLTLSYKDLQLLNPLTGMLPNFSNKEEMKFLLKVSTKFPSFKNVFEKVRFGRIVHLTSHADFISKKKADDNLPVYEGKFFNQFDGRFSGFNGVEDMFKYGNKSSSLPIEEGRKKSKDGLPESRFYIKTEKWVQISKNHSERYMLAWRSLTSATNTRTCIATILPFVPASQSVQFLTTRPGDLLYLCGLFNSVVFDFLLKKKLNGIDLTQSVINQVPVPRKEQMDRSITFNDFSTSVKQHISVLVFSLLKDEDRLNPLFESLDLQTVIEKDRFELIRRLDLLFMMLYELRDDDIELVLSEFSKQYSRNDLKWFKERLNLLLTDNSVGSANTTATLSPI